MVVEYFSESTIYKLEQEGVDIIGAFETSSYTLVVRQLDDSSLNYESFVYYNGVTNRGTLHTYSFNDIFDTFEPDFISVVIFTIVGDLSTGEYFNNLLKYCNCKYFEAKYIRTIGRFQYWIIGYSFNNINKVYSSRLREL